jgi:serine/threonine protein kinase/CHASE2 domain-containing sensor protein
MAARSGSRRPLYFGIAGAAAAALMVAFLASVRAFQPVDLMVYDFLLEVRCAKRPPSLGLQQVVLVLVDEDTQSELGVRWPWPRSYHARLIDALEAAGARAIGFDMLFLDPSVPEEDNELAAAFRRHGNIVIGAKLEATDNREVAGGAAAFDQMRLLLPIFRDDTSCALVNLPFDGDQVVRRFLPALDVFGTTYYSFATLVYRTARGQFPPLPLESEHGIDFLGRGGTFRAVSAAQVLSGKAMAEEPGLFRQKIVLVGVTLAEAKEMFSTPVSKGDRLCAGVEVHANVLAGMIDRSVCAQVSRPPQVFFAVLFALVAAYLALFRSGKVVVIVYGLMIALLLAVAIPLMVYQGLYLDLTYPLVAIGLAYILGGLPARQPMVLHTRLGPYELLGELGRGGMAVVYQARHPKTREVVALKQMLPEYAADEKALQRFLREMELLQQLDHPNIVRIVDAGEVGGQPYYAMEYVSGKNLDDVLREQFRLGSHDVRRICEGVARALHQAHQLGVIHRDLKPSNIMLTGTGTPKLTDFGIACKMDAPHLTQAGVLIGTPQYMSPEQCQGEDVTAKSDIYSLGATMYHLLTGSPPFPWPEVNRIIRSHLHDEPLDIRMKNPNVDEPLAALIMACLAKDLAQRPADMLAVAKALDPFHSPTALELTPPTGIHPVARDGHTVAIAAPPPVTSQPWPAGTTDARHAPPPLHSSQPDEATTTSLPPPQPPSDPS